MITAGCGSLVRAPGPLLGQRVARVVVAGVVLEQGPGLAGVLVGGLPADVLQLAPELLHAAHRLLLALHLHQGVQLVAQRHRAGRVGLPGLEQQH